MPTDAQLAWVAGLFEGEGTITIAAPAGRNLGQLTVRLPNTDRAYINLMNRWWPGHIAKQERDGLATVWSWQRSSRKAADFIEAIVPYIVSERIRDRALLALEYQAAKRNGARGDGRYAELQRELHEQMSRLGRGVAMGDLPVADALDVLRRRRQWHDRLRTELAREIRRKVRQAQDAGMATAEIARRLELDRSTLYRTYVTA